MASENLQSDKRKHSRILVNFDILYKANDSPEVRMIVGEEEKYASMMNVSEGGLALVTDFELPEQTELEIQFHLIFQDHQTPPIPAVGQVRYCAETADNKQKYYMGIEFIEIDEADKKLIKDFAKSVPGSKRRGFIKK